MDSTSLKKFFIINMFSNKKICKNNFRPPDTISNFGEMHKLKQLITGKKEKAKKHSKEEDAENANNNNDGGGEGDDHYEVDFDKQFEQAKRTSSSVPPLISACDYRGSPANRRSKSPSPYPPPSAQSATHQQQHPKKLSAPVPAAGSRKCSDPLTSRNSSNRRKEGSNPSFRLDPAQAEKERVKRKLTETQQRQAKDIVESINWIQPAAPPQVCYAASVQPQIVQSQTIVPQIHICEALPIARPGRAMATIIPVPSSKMRGSSPQQALPLAASGKVINAIGTHRKPGA